MCVCMCVCVRACVCVCVCVCPSRGSLEFVTTETNVVIVVSLTFCPALSASFPAERWGAYKFSENNDDDNEYDADDMTTTIGTIMSMMTTMVYLERSFRTRFCAL